MHPPLACQAAFACCIAASACGGSSAAAEAAAADGLIGKLTVTGSSTIAPLAAEIGRRFEQLHPQVRVDVQTGGSSRGVADARSGAAEIGMVSRFLAPDESDLGAVPIAADGVGLIVHGSNPVRQLSDAQVVAIYTGEIENWSELGGPDLPIQVVHKAEGRATLELFLGHFGLENPAVEPDVIIGHNEQGVKTVAGAPGAIGYVSIGTAEADIGAGVAIRLLPMAGVEASTASVARGEFPLCRILHLVTRSGETGPLAAAFLAYAQSDAVHDLIAAQSFVPLQP